MAVGVYVPRDAAAQSLGAEDVAQAISNEIASRRAEARVVRNGTRGMCWLEPLVEVQTASGRVAYGPVSAHDVKGLFDAGFLEGGPHPLLVGPVETVPYFGTQERLTFARVGITDPVNLDDYLANDGYKGLRRALDMGQAAIVQEVTDSGLRGRGGAAFPTGIKWKTVLDAPANQKYVTCNADEGDSGTFADRMLMEGDPFVLIEGMTIAALAVGANKAISTFASNIPTRIVRCLERSRPPISAAISATISSAAENDSISRFDWVPEPTSAAKRPRCSRASRASAARSASRPPLPADQGTLRDAHHRQQRHLVGERSDHPPTRAAPTIETLASAGLGERSRSNSGGNIKRGGLIEKAFGPRCASSSVRLWGRERVGSPISGRSSWRSSGRIHARVPIRYTARL